MKREDWHPVYQHYVNSGRRHTAMFFNGERIPWDKAWKEIRRSGARECNDGQETRLPADVVMRSPSPALVIQSFIPRPAEVAHRSKLYEIPSNLLRIEILNYFQQLPTRFHLESDTPSCDQHSLFNPTRLDIDNALLQPSSSVSDRGSRQEIDSDIDNLSNALYQLANGNCPLRWPGEHLPEPLDIIINKTPKYILLKLLEGDSLVFQATMENIMRTLSYLGRRDDFFSLFQVISRFHPKWFDHGGYLGFAAGLGCAKSCRLLLQTWCWAKPDSFLSNWHEDTCAKALELSIQRGHVECAEVIVENVFKSGLIPLKPENIQAYSVFWTFLEAITCPPLSVLECASFDLWNANVLHILQLFLEAGAKIDLVPNEFLDYDRFAYAKHWTPTALDHIYFLNPELYSYLIENSTEIEKGITRAGAHRSASQGIDSLRSYLLSRASHTPAQQDEFMEIILTEELGRDHACKIDVDFNAVKTLIDYNLDLQKLHWKMNPSTMLYCVIAAARKQGMHPAVDHIVKTLIYMGAVVVTATISEAVEGKDTALLQLLSLHSADFKNQGVIALYDAVTMGNCEAIDLLLEMGVDINATLEYYKGRGERKTAILALVNMRVSQRESTPVPKSSGVSHHEMPKYLISRNIKLRLDSTDRDLRHLLCPVIYEGFRGGWDYREDTLKTVKMLLDAEPLANDLQENDPCPLEACLISHGELYGDNARLPERFALLDYLLERGVLTHHSGVLALLIKYRAPEGTIEKVLHSGVDINIRSGNSIRYMEGPLRLTPLQAAIGIGSWDLVQHLVQRGAYVNQALEPDTGRTALHAAFNSHYVASSISIDLIKFLIDNGADVNALPASCNGRTGF
ncbi:hypothetical protein O1611_g8600 [Lasiodiplodia mahajangana]|uniref:Uncharacterized protein n=1 Tax=Lasiodiplodia mahajangana TaxID=1108764 RepID=A0ACC2JCA0_9PEZI|nr:hypothetical protein O1611_g8600 [Lasiodiplodia mahajangana]